MNAYSAYRTEELADLYDAVYTYQRDIEFWRFVSRAAGGSILDLGCGTGRVLLPLAAEGRTVTGIDASEQMLGRCRAKLAREPQEVRDRVEIVCADMTSFDIGSSFSAVLCAFNSFHHLRTVDEQLACLERCYAHLQPQGLLVLDLFNPDPDLVDVAPESATPHVLEVEWTEGRMVRRWMSACVYDRSHQCNECEMTYEVVEPDGLASRTMETFPLRLIYRYELEHLLARCGFRLLALYGDYDRTPFANDSVGMIAVAVRGATALESSSASSAGGSASALA